MMEHELLHKWHNLVFGQDDVQRLANLNELLADEVEFHSPTVSKPMQGKFLVTLVLKSVLEVTDNFTYHREWIMPTENGGCEMALEFSADMTDGEGKVWHLKAIDLIRWNSEGQIIHFEVMARPMKAVKVLYEQMTAKVMAGMMAG